MAKGTKKAKVAGDALVYVVLDKSGSMEPIRDATIAGVNEFIQQTAKANPVAKFHLSMFDTAVKKVHNGVDIGQADGIETTYFPGGSTALLDGIGRAIKEVEDLPSQPEKVVIVIMTDGAENASREYTREAVKALVARHEKTDDWQFLFLGANLDAFSEAGAIGMGHAALRSASWAPTARGTQAAYMAVSTSTADYLGGATASASLTQDSYNKAFDSLPDVDAPVATTTPPPVAGVAKPVTRSTK